MNAISSVDLMKKQQTMNTGWLPVDGTLYVYETENRIENLVIAKSGDTLSI